MVPSISDTGSTAGASPTAATGKTSATPRSGKSSSGAVSDMGALQKDHPEEFNQMMTSLAQTICGQSKDANDRLKQIRKEYEKGSQ